ncbi:FAD dependent oxidoreductase family protein [Candida albicans]|uniref:L-2-hydroxyglutarate dehydrogenase, mitochondrial n=1 Tax=Candida albicans TaxID=5476 RepID=A0A8H6F0U6_CANAX|nr:FAD dependent oxidoreductase family protein [Candida albicans]
MSFSSRCTRISNLDLTSICMVWWIYYPPNSLKSKLCIAGKNKIYDAWAKGNFQVALKQCGKWVVAQTDKEAEYLEKINNIAKEVSVPVNFISPTKAKAKYPLIRAETAILESPTTGIISSHDYTLFHQARFESNNGTIGLNTELTDLEYNKGTSNYTLRLESDAGEMELTSDNVVNAAGLYAAQVSNLFYSPTTSIGKITDVLIYPCPNPNASSLGTHLTFDLGGQLRFGPDLEWLDIKRAEDIDYTPNPQNLKEAYKAIKTYFPSITLDSLHPSYSGVRPKIYSLEENMKKFADFEIKQEPGYPGFVNLLGMESPGLTASWAIGEYVKDLYHK